MFTEEALKQNSFLLMNNFKKLIAEVNNAIPDELRICSKLDPRSVMISNGNIVFATGKRLDGYTIKKFFEAFEITIDSFNREVIEELVIHLQMDAMKYPSICFGINNGRCSELVLGKMWYNYQMLYHQIKYKAIRVGIVYVRPRTEFYQIPFVFDIPECQCHEYFNLNYIQYVKLLQFICKGGSVRKAYEDFRCAVRRDVAARMNERRKKQVNVVASKPNDHLKQGCVKAPTQRMIKDK